MKKGEKHGQDIYSYVLSILETFLDKLIIRLLKRFFFSSSNSRELRIRNHSYPYHYSLLFRHFLMSKWSLDVFSLSRLSFRSYTFFL